MSDTFVTTIRFNLDREEDRRALAYLQGEGRDRYGSYTQAIIAAVNGCWEKLTEQVVEETDPTKEKEEALLQRIEETIRRAIEESPIGSMASLMRLFQMAPIAASVAEPAQQVLSSVEDEPEEDWSGADDFLNGL